MSRFVKVAATQMACSWTFEENRDCAERLVRTAAAEGANIILLQELFMAPYFCQDRNDKYFSLAETVHSSSVVKYFSALAKELSVVLPLSFFERDGNKYFNSLVVIDADGSLAHHYRKIHIPDAPGYFETYYFSSGDLGYCVADTAFGRIGVGICWDQWFPECARIMALQGAEILFYPTAIGSEPADGEWDSKDHWQRVIAGHAGANLVPIVVANRIGTEQGEAGSMTFYGSSFIADHEGELIAVAQRRDESIIYASVDLQASKLARDQWGIFQTRQPENYGPLLA